MYRGTAPVLFLLYSSKEYVIRKATSTLIPGLSPHLTLLNHRYFGYHKLPRPPTQHNREAAELLLPYSYYTRTILCWYSSCHPSSYNGRRHLSSEDRSNKTTEKQYYCLNGRKKRGREGGGALRPYLAKCFRVSFRKIL